MSLDKAIEHGKERRKQYTGSKSIDPTCRNHGGCDWCTENRMIRSLKELEDMEQQIEEYNSEVNENGNIEE